MKFSLASAILGLAVLASAAVSRPVPPSCRPTLFTTTFVTEQPTVITTQYTTYLPVTKKSTVTIPHSCFSYTSIIPQSDNSFCGTATLTCPPTPDCAILSTFTAPCKDACCPVTPTVTTLGACVTCQTGCKTFWTTVTQTAGCRPSATPLAAN